MGGDPRKQGGGPWEGLLCGGPFGTASPGGPPIVGVVGVVGLAAPSVSEGGLIPGAWTPWLFPAVGAGPA